MASEKDFYRDPRTFMDNNIVLVSNNISGIQSRRSYKDAVGHGHRSGDKHLLTFKVSRVNNATVQGPPNAEVWGLYAVSWSDYHQQGFRKNRCIQSYYCDYTQDGGLTAHLGVHDDYDYMFTAEMNGCTFAVGSRTDKGTLSVGHFNRKGVGNKARFLKKYRQERAQAKDAKDELGDNAQLIEPNDYMPDVLDKVTLFGRRQNRIWSFYTLKYRKIGPNSYIHCGVHPHVSGVAL